MHSRYLSLLSLRSFYHFYNTFSRTEFINVKIIKCLIPLCYHEHFCSLKKKELFPNQGQKNITLIFFQKCE